MFSWTGLYVASSASIIINVDSRVCYYYSPLNCIAYFSLFLGHYQRGDWRSREIARVREKKETSSNVIHSFAAEQFIKVKGNSSRATSLHLLAALENRLLGEENVLLVNCHRIIFLACKIHAQEAELIVILSQFDRLTHSRDRYFFLSWLHQHLLQFITTRCSSIQC